MIAPVVSVVCEVSVSCSVSADGVPGWASSAARASLGWAQLIWEKCSRRNLIGQLCPHSGKVRYITSRHRASYLDSSIHPPPTRTMTIRLFRILQKHSFALPSYPIQYRPDSSCQSSATWEPLAVPTGRVAFEAEEWRPSAAVMGTSTYSLAVTIVNSLMQIST